MSPKNVSGAWHRIMTKRRSRKPPHDRPSRRPMMLEQLEARWCLSANVLTYHNDIGSTGLNNSETLLTPTNVNVNSFGKLATASLDGQMYAQPLVDTGVAIVSGVNTSSGVAGVHDVVFVATEHDSLYAIDAKQGDGAVVLWKRSFLDITVPGYNGTTAGTDINYTTINNTTTASSISTVTRGDVAVNIGSEVGITGTPVIDPATNTIFLDVKTAEVIGGATYYVQRLHAINIADGTDRGVPYLIGATTNDNTNSTNIYVYGIGDGAVTDPYNGTGKQVVQFNALREANRPALSFVNNQVYLAWASHGDNGPYHGWVATWTMSSTALTLTGVLCTSPNNGLSGIWQGGGKLAFEPDGSAFYFETGNGDGGAPVLNAQGFPVNANYNEALVKAVADPTTTATNQNPNGWGLKVADYFIPYNVAALDAADSDFGSGAPTVLPDSAGITGHPHLILAAGKSGQIYVIDRDNMGHYSPTGDNVLNAVPNGSGQNTPPVQLGGSLSTASYFNGRIYWASAYSSLASSYVINTGGTLTTTSQTAANLGYSPGSFSISANGTANGIAWVYDRNLNVLHAYDASSLSTELWNSSQHAGGADNLGAAVEFALPTVANGEVFAGTSNSLVIYGLNQAANAVPNAPVLSATAISGSSINLTWTDSTTTPNLATAYSIEESTDGSNFSVVATAPAAATSIAIGGLQTQTTYYFRIRGLNAQGYSNYSNSAQATTSNTLNGLNFVNNAAGLPNIVVSLAYYDNEYGGGFVPSPWQGSPNVTFFGNQTTGIYDGGAIMFTNTGTANAVLSPGVVVDNFASGASYQLWDSLIGTQTIIAPGQSLILTQTASGNFDTSDTPVGTTFANRSLIRPHVHFTLNGTPYILVDTTQVLNDAGWDEGNIQNISESSVWTQNQVIAGGFGGATGLTLNGAAAITGGDLVLTNGGANQAGSVFTSNRFDITGFTSQFTFQTTGTYAYANTGEGFTFTIQGTGPTALGGTGSALGYGAGGGNGGINNSVAIKFDLNNNSGEGNDSTGLYTDAASPTNVGSIDLSSTGINFHSGDLFRVNLTYVGTTLTVVINDLTTNASSSQNYTVNIPGIVGGSTGYVGFTGATGSQESIQNIISWAYAPTAATSPNAPSGLGATPASATSVSLNWTNNAVNQTSFNLDRATDPGFTQNLITENLPASPNSFTDTYTGLAPGSTYYYRLRAFNAAGNSGYSNVATVTIPLAPPKPTNQMVTGVSATEIDISWQDNAGHLADGYHILRSINHGSFSVAATLPPTSRSAPSTYAWSDTNLTPNTYYEYHIVAFNISGNNDFAGVNATTLLPAPILVYSRFASNVVTLYYTVPSGATSMNVYRGTASGAETLLASGSVSGSYIDNTVTNGTTYYYYVTAVNANSLPIANEESAPSNQSSPAISGGAFQWTGNGANANWTTPGNWSGGLAPTGDGNETLVFPSGAAKLTNIDDLPVGANAFAGITTAASGYSITVNNPLALGAGGLSLTAAGTETWNAASGAGMFLFSGESFTTASGATLTVNANITEMNGRLTIAGSGSTTLGGSLAGISGLTTTETGTLTLNAASAYTGPTLISAGTVNAYTNTPLGANSDVTVATGATLNAVGTFMAGAGLQGQYYNITPASSNFASLSALNSSLAGQTPALTALSSTTSLNNSFDFDATGSAFPAPYNANATNFEAVFTGLFNAPTTGTYTFDTGSDDGSMIFIDGNVVVNNNAFQPVTVRSGTVPLTAGTHNIVIAFYQGGGGYGLYADVQVPNGTLVRLPNSMLSGVATSNLQLGSLAGGGTVALGANSLTVGGANHNASFTGTLTGSVNITKVGTGSQTIGQPKYSGPTTISAGTLQLGDGTHTFSPMPPGTIVDNGTLAIAIPSGATLSYSNAISGIGGLTVSGGILSLSGANSYTGPTVISSGTVNANSDSALGSNSDVTVAAGATLNVTARGSGGLAGTYYNSAPNNAPTYLFADTATVAAYVAGLPLIATDRSSTANSQNNGGAVFDYGTSGQGFPSAVLANPNQFVAVWTGQFSAPTSGVYAFDTGSDDGSMLFIDGNAVVFNNAYQPLTVQSGSVPLTQGSHSIFIAYYQGGGQYGMYADVQVPGGTLQRIPNALLNTYANLQIGSLGGAGNVFVGGSNSLTVGGDNNNSTFSGVLSGSGYLVKNGTGTMTVSGPNTYTGPTVINQGTVVAAANNALGTAAGGTTVATGAALSFSSNVNYTTAEPVSIAGIGPAGNGAIENISGTNSFGGPITLTGGGTVGSLAGSLTLGGTISGTGSLTFTGAGNATVNGTISGTPPLNVIKNGTGVVALAATDSAPSTTVNAGTLNCAAIGGNGITTVSSGSSLIANHIVQGSLVIGGAAGSPATAIIAATDANGNPLNAVASSSVRAAIIAATSAPQSAPLVTASATASPTATAPTSIAASSDPSISAAVALSPRGSTGSPLAIESSFSDSSGLIAIQSPSGTGDVSNLFGAMSGESERSSLLTNTDSVLTADRATRLERQTATIANGSGDLVQPTAAAAASADADLLEWAASTPATRPSADAELALLFDDLLDAIGRQLHN